MDIAIFLFYLVVTPTAIWFIMLFFAWIAHLCKGKPGNSVLVRTDGSFFEVMNKK